MAIIKLTDFTDESPIYLNKKFIESFYKYKNGSEVWTISSDKTYIVKETPEEILALIKEAENGK